tara:strand:- start:2187 stop:2429 length:243 start_codon:yes stop_codon:yes gene_type:complete
MKTTITVIVALLISLSSFAQPQRINYKAVIKDSNGNLVVNQTLDVKFTILKNSDNMIVYEETHSNKTTDSYKLLKTSLTL